MTKNITGISSIENEYDLFIFDLWGVLHCGEYVFKEALDVLRRLKDRNVFILSNAPRHKIHAVKRIEELGINKDLYFDMYTSGTDCFEALKNRVGSYKNLGKNFYSLSPDKDNSLLDGLEYVKVQNISDADFIVAVGISTQTENDHVLNFGLKHGLPLICANPDLVVVHKNKLELCSGSFAIEYERLGGLVYFHGKPQKKMFEVAINSFPFAKKPIMIGDSLRTDIKGANDASIDSILVVNKGVHKDSNVLSKSKELFEEYLATPTYVIDEVVW